MTVVHMVESRNFSCILFGQTERKSYLGRSSRRWEENSKVDIIEMEAC